MTTRNALAIGVPLAVMWACPAIANESRTSGVSREAQEAFDRQRFDLARVKVDAGGSVMSSGSPNSRAVAGFSASNVQFAAEDGETTLSLAISFDLETYRPPEAGSTYFRVHHTKIGLVATAPTGDDKSKNPGSLFSGDSLVSGSKLKLSVTRFSSKLGLGEGAKEVLGAAYGLCVRKSAATWISQNPGVADAEKKAGRLGENLARQLEAQDANYDGILEMAATDDPKGTGAFISKSCLPGNPDGLRDEGELMDKYAQDPEAFHRMFFPKDGKVSFSGLDASVGREEYTYLDRTAFKLLAKPRTSWEVAGYYGFVNARSTTSARVRAVYGQSWEDREAAKACQPGTVSVVPECLEGPDGKTMRKQTSLLSGEIRHLINADDDSQIAIAPQVTYRFDDKNIGVEVPIYLSPDKDGKLSGGLKAVWNSKGDEFGLGLFVGVPFSIHF